MSGSLGFSEWLPALITFWLAAQLPLGMFVGSTLRRAAMLSTVEAGPAAVQRGRDWQKLLPVRTIPAAPRVI